MKQTVPHTPFSTALSRSARETELRIRNIMSGPKRRPPVLFLALIFSICIFCGNLVSCQVAEADSPDNSALASQPPDVSVPENPPMPWTPVELDSFISPDCVHDGPSFLTAEQAAILEDLPADKLPKDAVDLDPAPLGRDYWQNLLLPMASDKAADVTVYGVVGDMEHVEPLVSPLLWGGVSPDGIVLRYKNQAKYFPLVWDINAKFNANPPLLAGDLDGDGQLEAALSLAWGSGTGCYAESLYIFDLDTMTYTVPDYTDIPLELTLSPDGTTVDTSSGPLSLETDVTELGGRFDGRVEAGNVIRFYTANGQMFCQLDLDFACDTLGYLVRATFPVVYEDGAYRLGEAGILSGHLSD